MNKSIKILVIEDDILIAMQLEDSLIRMNHEVVSIVDNSKDALEIAKEKEIDLIFSDVRIKGSLNGIETSSLLQKLYDIPIVFITAYKDNQTLQGVANLDSSYIIKPFREDEIEALVNISILKYNLPKNKKIINIDQNYHLEIKSNKLFYINQEINLTKKELKFIHLLINQKDKIVSYTTIENEVWGDQSVSNETRRQLLYRFKRKVPSFPLKLIKGQGYQIISK